MVCAHSAQVGLQGISSVHILALCLEEFDNLSLDSAGIQHSLCRCESLGDDDKHGFLEVDVLNRPADIDRIDVGKEFELAALGFSVGRRVKLECFVNKFWAKVATTDADRHHAHDGLAGVATQCTATNLFSKSFNRLLDGHDVSLNIRLSLLRAQLHMPHLTTLRRVHNITCKHRLDIFSDALFCGNSVEQSETLGVNFGVSVIKDDTIANLLAESSIACLVLKKFTKVSLACYCLVVLLEGLHTGSLLKSYGLNHLMIDF